MLNGERLVDTAAAKPGFVEGGSGRVSRKAVRTTAQRSQTNTETHLGLAFNTLSNDISR